jgi:hypothetical protein
MESSLTDAARRTRLLTSYRTKATRVAFTLERE